ncbi:unnamed protein product [Parnassius apollo]|uniref:(apollo) hypothetical protein n=1 Tax=Parnassius apollo TaxID=110799 RepID=A0A8S3XLG6_PARAO|nr:unnamed protein product [Parnassius apollo]
MYVDVTDAAVAPAAPRGSVVACWRQWWLVAGVGAVSAQRSPLGWAMGSSQRLAAVAAVSHARHYYNHTQPNVAQTEAAHYNVNVFFVSATLCGVLVAVCAACWRRSPAADKPDDVIECRGVYTVSTDARLQVQEELPGPPPAYESVVDGASGHKPCQTLQEVVTEPCPRCQSTELQDSGLPSYEAAVLLRDTRL